ncbi:response regulator [Cupriavidus agavae]|uniref:DNA-binding NarL/FixJ family response regulator n=1 Tax=Cupriavidus agavae TaxID=1001822 RepID=A0A4Q7R9V0_9BURK|nr:response regulator [Cupriavidus agavae]RZT29107.1 DNA-binding NarL/FixJ family response regulator [Cupriavidus agavae]
MGRVVIAEGEALSRHGLRQMLEASGHEIVGEAEDGLQATHMVLSREPDLLVLALKLDRLSGLEVIKRLRAQAVNAKILVVSSQDDSHTVGLCIHAGANGFVSKIEDLSEVQRALDAFSRGRSYFPDFEDPRSLAKSEESQLAHLTDRERTVLTYLARGYRLTKIAQLLVVGQSTVSTYKTRLLRKLNASTIVELADIARRNHLVDMPVAATDLRSLPDWLSADSSVIRNLLDTIPSSVSIRDAQGSILFANAYLREQLGADLAHFSQIVPEALERVLGVSESQANEILDAFRKAGEQGKPFMREYALNVHGIPRSAVIWAAPLQDESGSLSAMICGSHDITTIDLAIRELRQSREELGRIAKLNGMLVDKLKLELQEAARAARAEIENAIQAGSAEDRASSLDRAQRALQMLEQRISSVGELVAHADIGRPLRQRCNLHDLFLGGVRAVVESGKSDGRDVTIEYAGSPALCIWVEPTRFQHILFSLVDIAYRASTEGTLTVRMQPVEMTRGLVDVRLEIIADAASASLALFHPEINRLNDILAVWEGRLQAEESPIRLRTSGVLQIAI